MIAKKAKLKFKIKLLNYAQLEFKLCKSVAKRKLPSSRLSSYLE